MSTNGRAEGRDHVAPRTPLSTSPFPPIGEYGFLSDGEATMLIAPSGNIEWFCVPRMDSPSVFGAILDRDAGGFRLGPSDLQVPAARRYLPGTMVLETSWGSPSGWIIVRDVMLLGPWRHSDERSKTQRRPPTDYDASHVLVRMVRCVNGEMQLTLDCEPVFDYGRSIGTWRYTEDGYRQGAVTAEGSDVELVLTSDMNIGFEGPRAMARTLIKEGETRFCALSWNGAAPPRTEKQAYKRTGVDGPSLAALARARNLPRPSMALVPRAVRADPQGPHLRTERSRRRGGHHVPARDAGRRAQLGLSLQLDPRLHVRPVGSLHAGVRVGGQRLPPLHRGPRRT